MRAGRITGAASQANPGTSGNRFARHDIDLTQVAIDRQVAVIMVDHNHVAIASIPATLCDGDRACRSSPNRGTQSGSNIDARMARPEIIAGQIMIAGRPNKTIPDRSGATRVACAVQCTGARHARDNPNHGFFLAAAIFAFITNIGLGCVVGLLSGELSR